MSSREDQLKRILSGAIAVQLLATGLAAAQDIKIALISSKTGPFEAYAKQTEVGFNLGLEFVTQGTMTVNGKKLVVLSKDDQGKPDLAKTFQLIAKHGPDVFYKGEIAQAIVAAAQSRTRAGMVGFGKITLADLAAYDVKIRQPIVGHYRGYTVASMPPPSSGGLTIIQMLEMLERFPMGDKSHGFGFGAKNTLHVMFEAMPTLVGYIRSGKLRALAVSQTTR